MEEVIAKLASLYPDVEGTDRDLLTHAFGSTQFVHLRRANVIAQAVSHLRAEQTDIWQLSEDSDPVRPLQEPQYDFAAIHGLVREAEDHNAAWQSWFRSNGIAPYSVLYEDLDKDPVEVSRRVLDFLRLKLPAGCRMSANNKRLSDQINRDWIDRYRSDFWRRR